jgi:hypothetical protein
MLKVKSYDTVLAELIIKYGEKKAKEILKNYKGVSKK